MKEKIRVITLKKNVPEDTISKDGFHLLNMGKEGTWLVDQEHPGYRRCIQKAMQLAASRGDKDLVDKYSKLPLGKDPAAFKLPSILKKQAEESKKDTASEKPA